MPGRPPTKVCTRCGIRKSLTEFYRDRRQRDGYRPSCKKCWGRGRDVDPSKHAEYMRQYRAKRADMAQRPDWDETWASFAAIMSFRSRCYRAKIGAIIVSVEERVVATGYNGPPAGWVRAETSSCLDWCPRAQRGAAGSEPLDEDYGDCPANHAEINALMHSSRDERMGGTIYVTGSVCMACAKAVANSGLVRVVLVDVDYEHDAHRHPEEVRTFLEECGLEVIDVVVGA